VEVSVLSCRVAAGFLATAQSSFSHEYQRPQAKEYGEKLKGGNKIPSKLKGK
jgi:hypothetical protein